MADTSTGQDAGGQQIIKAAVLLFKNYQVENEALQQRLRQQDEMIQASILQLKNEARLSTQQAQEIIKSDTKRELRSSLLSEINRFKAEIQAVIDELQQGFNCYAVERRRLALQTKMLSWKAIIGVTFAVVLMLAASLLVTWHEKNRRDEIIAQYQVAQVQLDAATAESRMIKTQCGTKLCIKIDSKAGLWGENGEYAIPILK